MLVVLLAACLYDLIIFRFDHSLNSVDGAFQTYNAVHSFLVGERVGVDFQSYLGVLLPLSLVPMFWALGGTLFASTVASYVAIYFGMLAAAFALTRYSAIRGKAAGFWSGAIFFALIAIVPPVHANLLLPGASLRPLRWALPFVLAFAAYPLFRRIQLRTVRGERAVPEALLVGVVGGLALLWSNDLGPPSLIALLGSLVLLAAAAGGVRVAAVCLVVASLSALATAAVLVSILSGGHPIAWYNYNFVDIANDQFWLFIPWDEDRRVFSLLEVWKILFRHKGIPGAVLIALAVASLLLAIRILRRRGAPARQATQLFMLAASAGGCLVPQIGGHISTQYLPGAGLASIFAVIVVFPRLPLAAAKTFRRMGRKAPLIRRAVGLPTVAFACVALMHLVMAGRVVAMTKGKTDMAYFPMGSEPGDISTAVEIPALGVRTRDPQASAILTLASLKHEFARWPARSRIFSDYYSAASIAAGAAQPSPLPTIIHALGAQRETFRNDLIRARAPIATTLFTAERMPWSGWNLRSSWAFYHALIEMYEPFAASSHQLYWRLRAVSLAAAQPISCDFEGIADGIAVIRIQGPPGSDLQESWLTDVLVDFGPEAAPPRFRTVDELAGPFRDPARRHEKLAEIDGYGLPPQRRQGMMVEVRASGLAAVRVTSRPAGRGYGVPAGNCRAWAVMPDPFHRRWPPLTRPLLAATLDDIAQRENLPRLPGRR